MKKKSSIPIIWALATMLIFASIGKSEAQSVDLAGLGAVPCSRFLADLDKNHDMAKEYFSWAQGYMSGLLIRAPKGIDEKLKLIPNGFGIEQQFEFLVDYCRKNGEESYIDATQKLYKKLRGFVER